MTHTSHTLDVPGGRLHYEVRGKGPILAVIGSPMDTADFAGLADALAVSRTVITMDPRGISASVVDDPHQDATPQLRGDDVIAILDALGAGTADVFGSSGGAVTGLALVARHPGRVGTLVAHEPPLLELLPDAAEQRAKTDDVVETFHTQGIGAAWMKFMANAGFAVGGDIAPADSAREPSAQELSNSAHFFDHHLRPTTRFVPDVATLTSSSTRIVVGIGVDSRHLITYRTTHALADLLGTPPVEFPADHAGFLAAPEEFATRLVDVMRS
ncbi:putative hydrolase or acyltransferase of alpha/beta superfamily [Mycolicibacterium chubuense NBB4]|uniref:Putative hydrolase or acyltransferase of alpha/beta superfamily n=1 Tax=Mycolicibacterium chubuense (strain NBB4) TaxID=710421 RepID=I4BL18_MYCCN|nr:alpha/beta hydrolase [Mycolicibacterium chubuense]AFM17975.1 putative hydrolase or acyltransferase of alpha/beta superfamily [Mycolicibacterium chubuense NBB4]